MPALENGRENDDDERLDRYLVRLGYAASRRAASELVASGGVLLNGHRCAKGATVASGDRVELIVSPEPAEIASNPDLKIEVLYEDAGVVVVNKPPLLPCHPLRPTERDTVMNAIVAVYPETAIVGDKPLEGGLVHRLDNGTSGALIVAREANAFAMLRDAISHGGVTRHYRALVAGRLTESAEIAWPIAHHPKNVRKMVAVDLRSAGANPGSSSGVHIHGAPRSAATLVEPLEHFAGFTLVAVTPRTGRRHQIRVHLARLGFPLAGDALYGGPPLVGLAPGRFWLHLAAVEFDSPVSGRARVEAPPAHDLRMALERLRANAPAPS